MNRTAASGAAVVLALGLLVSCGDDGDSPDEATPSTSSSESSPTPTPTQEPDTDFGKPATGPLIKGTGYQFKAPQGWTNITKQAREVNKLVDRVAGESESDDGFQDNVYVSFDSAPGSTLDQLEASVPDQVSKSIKRLDVRPRVVLDGVEALHHRGRSTASPTDYFLDQFVTLDDDGLVTVITFSLSPDLPEKARNRTVDSVMATWKWRD